MNLNEKLSTKQRLTEGLLDRKKMSGNADHDKGNELVGKIIDYAGNQDNQDDAEEDDLDEKSNLDDSEKIMTEEAEELIMKFLVNTDSPFLDSINIIIVMRCIPTQITNYN